MNLFLLIILSGTPDHQTVCRAFKKNEQAGLFRARDLCIYRHHRGHERLLRRSFHSIQRVTPQTNKTKKPNERKSDIHISVDE